VKRYIYAPLTLLLLGLALSTAASASECVKLVGADWSTHNTLDPAHITNIADSMHVYAAYEPLIWVDSNFNLSPDLAESWSSNQDGTQWTFKLREGVKFHDGSDFTADDVVFTYRRLIDPKIGSGASAELSFLKPDGIQAIDTHTVRFTSQRPVVEMPLLLSTKFALILSSKAQPESISTHENGTGPFIVENFLPEAPRTTLKRNPNYWRQGYPKASCIEISSITDPVSRAAALRSGQADILLTADPSTLDSLRSANIPLAEAKAGTFFIMAMETDVPPFNDVRVRQAMKKVIERAAMVKLSVLGYGEAGSDNPIPPSAPDAYTSEVPHQDIEGAKALLAAAGYPNGLKVDLYNCAPECYPGTNVMAEAYKQMAAQAGIDVNIIASPLDTYWNDIWLKKPFVVSLWSRRPDVSAFPVGYRTDAKYNETHWMRKDFDALLDKAESTLDPTERTVLYKKAQRILAEEGGAIIPVFSATVGAMRQGCSGFVPHVDMNRISYAEIHCD
jgi:peptide/nickel transport system substrate-binding protein